MRLTDRQIAKYQNIYLKTFGITVSKEDAYAQSMALVRLVKCLSKSEENNEYEQSIKLSREN